MFVSQRQDWVDSWRGLLIVLVVLGHAVGGAFHLQSQGTARDAFGLAYDVIYAFHMPAFFCLAGSLWHSGTSIGWSFVKKRFLRLMVPYFVFGVLSITIYHLALDGFSAVRADVADGYYEAKGAGGVWSSVCGLLSMGAWPEKEAYRYNSVLWFLPCMFLTQISFLFVARLLRSTLSKWCVGAVLLILAVAARVDLGGSYPMSLNRIPLFLLMMELGWVCAKHLRNEDRLNRLVLGIVGGVLLVSFVFLRDILPNTNVSYGSYWWALVFAFLAIAGTALSGIVAKAICCRALCSVGRSAITIMLLHKFLVVGFEFGHSASRSVLKGPLWFSGAYAVVLTIVSVGICCFVDRLIIRIAPWCIGVKGRNARDGGHGATVR